MSRRASSLNRVDSGMARELDTRYAHVKTVADNIDAVIKAASVDLEALAAALNEATDFEGITVVAGDTASWNPVTKVLTVPTMKGDTGDSLTMDSVVSNADDTFTWTFSDGTEFTTPALRGAKGDKGNKGDKGDTGESLRMSSVTTNLGDTFTWHFSDGSSFTTPSLKGVKGDKGLKGDRGEDVSVADITYLGGGVFRWTFSDGYQYFTPDLRGPSGVKGDDGKKGLKGDQGVSVHHLKLTSTTQPEGRRAEYGEKDTFSFYGDAAETILLGHFEIQNGESVYQAAQKGGFVGTESELNSMLANIKASSDQVSLLAAQVQTNTATVNNQTAIALAAAGAAEDFALQVQEALDAVPRLSVYWYEVEASVPTGTFQLPEPAVHALVFWNGVVQTPSSSYTPVRNGEGLITEIVFSPAVTGDIKIQYYTSVVPIFPNPQDPPEGGTSSPAWEVIDYLMGPTDLKGEAHLGKDTRGVVMQLVIDPNDGTSPGSNPFLSPLPATSAVAGSLSGFYESKDFSLTMFDVELVFQVQTFTVLGADHTEVLTRIAAQESPVDPVNYSAWVSSADASSYASRYFSTVLPYLRFMAFAAKEGNNYYLSGEQVVADYANDISIISLEDSNVPSGSKVAIAAYTGDIHLGHPNNFSMHLGIAHTVSSGFNGMSFVRGVGNTYLKLYLFQPEVPTEPVYVNLGGSPAISPLRFNPATNKWEIFFDTYWGSHTTTSMPPLTKGISCLTFKLYSAGQPQNGNIGSSYLAVTYSNSLGSNYGSVMQHIPLDQGTPLLDVIQINAVSCDVPILGIVSYNDTRGTVTNDIYPAPLINDRYMFDRILISELVGLNLTWDLDNVPVTIESLASFMSTTGPGGSPDL